MQKAILKSIHSQKLGTKKNGIRVPKFRMSFYIINFFYWFQVKEGHCDTIVEHTCIRCGKSFPKLWKFRRHNERQYKCRSMQAPIIENQEGSQIIAPTLQIKDQGSSSAPAPIDHA
ncbi:hypothetical protein RCL_jg9859.t1 [Rhizophagus clarus]|uniref:C2H2-type domain-containing protein n=1 Tax=Rhizophagus clarus TaxID=94130 RepID=A0A8H3QXA5_9GLOM|nr:hypothetical protein RCL_jg9859.t1 [Rhizophagus clarus]